MPVPDAAPCTVIPTLAFNLTMAHFWIVTVAGARMLIEFGMRCTVPAPAQVSLAVILLACVTTVPFSVTPHTNGATVVHVTATFVTGAAPTIPEPAATVQV